MIGTHPGACLCGGVRYEFTGSPIRTVTCHCSMCRRAAGAPMVTWVVVPRAAFRMVAGQPAWYPSSDLARRGFCPRCGSSLFYENARRGDEVEITAGTLDDPAAFPPQRHVWAPDKIAWVVLNDGLPRYRLGTGSEPVE